MHTINKRFAIIALLISVTVPAHAAPPLELYGQLTQGAMVRARTVPDAQVYLDDRALEVSQSGDFVFGFGRDAPPHALIKVYLPDGNILERELKIAQREYVVQRIDGLAQHQVSPPPQVHERIAEEAAMVGAVRRHHSLKRDVFDEFLWPAQGTITGVYGSSRILNGQPRSPHYGVDIACAEGSLVRAPAGGSITLVHDMYFSGLTVVLDHGYGISSTFLHLHKALVEVGSRVARGQPIAQVGASGRATGAHLDWRVNWFERRLDPQLVAQPR